MQIYISVDTIKERELNTLQPEFFFNIKVRVNRNQQISTCRYVVYCFGVTKGYNICLKMKID